MSNRARLHSLIKSSSRNRTFSWMLISHLHLCSHVFPLHYYSFLLLLSSLLSHQPLRFLLSPLAASLFFHVLICHALNKPRARVLLKVRLQEAFITWPFKEGPAGATTSGPTMPSLHKVNTQQIHFFPRLHHVFMEHMSRVGCPLIFIYLI